MSIGSRVFGAIGFKPAEKRDVQFSPALSVLLAAQSNVARAGINVTPGNAETLMAVRACVKVISEDVSSIPWMTYARGSGNSKERADAYPLYELLHDSPNPEMDAVLFKRVMMRHLLIYGNFYGLAIMKGGRAAEIWPIGPWRVQVTRNRINGALEYRVAAESGMEAILPSVGTGTGSTQQIWHIKADSDDGVIGKSPIQMARSAIGLGLAEQEWQSGFYSNGARPPFALQHPAALSEEAHNRLRTDMESTLTGLSNAHRIAILEEGMTAKELFITQEDQQFLQMRNFSVLEICRLYRISPHKAQITEGSMAYASVEMADLDHVTSTIRPWTTLLAASANRALIGTDERRQYFTEFMLQEILSADHKARSDFYRTIWNIGAISANEIRAAENMNPIPDGDTYFVPVNMQPLEVAASAEAAAAVPASPDGSTGNDAVTQAEQVAAAAS